MELEARSVTVRYGAREAVCDVGLGVGPGEILGVIGPNGSGKSTLLRALAGIRGVDGGEVCLDGRDLQVVGRRERGRAIALVPQETHVSTYMVIDMIRTANVYIYIYICWWLSMK